MRKPVVTRVARASRHKRIVSRWGCCASSARKRTKPVVRVHVLTAFRRFIIRGREDSLWRPSMRIRTSAGVSGWGVVEESRSDWQNTWRLVQRQRKRIAAIITEYRLDSHADVIVGRLLEGYEYNGRHQTPQVEVVSMYTDQVPSNDMSRAMAAKHGVKICPTVRNALVGDKGLAVQGVVLIGEHGNYPENEKGQKLYPRYELYKQIVDVFARPATAFPSSVTSTFRTTGKRPSGCTISRAPCAFP